MKCTEFFEMVPLLINNGLDKELEKEALEHLMKCPDCREELAFWTKIAKTQRVTPMDEGMKRSIAQRVLQHEDGVWALTKEAVNLYFKVIKAVL